jgi:hypothetical protein
MPSEGNRKFEPMFDSRKTFSDKAVDAADLVIDFATLGEYGLEPVDAPARSCESRRRLANRRSTGAWASAVDRFAVRP